MAVDRRRPSERGQDPNAQDDRRGADPVGDRAHDDDRHEAGDRDQGEQDAVHAASDVLRQVLLQLGLRRDGHDRVGDAGQEGNRYDDGEQ